jgi:hypothetical protein
LDYKPLTAQVKGDAMKKIDASQDIVGNPTRVRGGRGGGFPCSVLGVLMLTAATTDAAFAFGPYPPGTTIFVDAANTAGVQSGTSAQPFNTIQEGIDAAPAGATVGVAPGLYTGDQNHNLAVSKPLKLIGYDTQSTVIKASPPDAPADIVLITSGDVRVAGFKIISTQDLSNQPFADNIRILIPATSSPDSVRIERMVLSGSCFGIVGNAGIVDRTVIEDAKCVAMLSRLHVTNSLILNNAEGLTNESSEPVFIVNNTIVGNNLGISVGTTGIVSNNMLVGNTIGVSWVGLTDSSSPPQVLNNLFYGNTESNLGLAKPTPEIEYNTASEINGLPGNAGNIVADPKFGDAGAGDFHLIASSPAIDSGDNGTAPTHDFDGHHRPLDGDGDCSSIADIGAYETNVVIVSTDATCRRYVFDPDGPWVLSGCEIIDCCPECPGKSILDWEINVAGHPVKEFVLRFDGLDAATLRGIGIEGRAQWISADRLLVTGDRVALHGLPFPRNGESGALRMTAESFAADKRITGRLAIGVTQSVAGRQIAQATLEYLPPNPG